MSNPERVRITVHDHELDPKVGAVVEVLGTEDDVTLVRWRDRRWPMLTAHTEQAEDPR